MKKLVCVKRQANTITIKKPNSSISKNIKNGGPSIPSGISIGVNDIIRLQIIQQH